MKAFSYSRILLYLFSVLIGFSSCSKDDDNNTDPDIDVKNEFTYDGQTYALNSGELMDYGYDGAHSNIEFYIADLNDENYPVIPALLFVDLFSPHERGFRGGTFNFIDDYDQIEGKYYFDHGFVAFDLDIENETVEKAVEIKGGWVKVAGSGTDYKLEFNLITTEDKTIQGSYGLGFSFIENGDNLQGKSPRSKGMGMDIMKTVSPKILKK